MHSPICIVSLLYHLSFLHLPPSTAFTCSESFVHFLPWTKNEVKETQDKGEPLYWFGLFWTHVPAHKLLSLPVSQFCMLNFPLPVLMQWAIWFFNFFFLHNPSFPISPSISPFPSPVQMSSVALDGWHLDFVEVLFHCSLWSLLVFFLFLFFLTWMIGSICNSPIAVCIFKLSFLRSTKLISNSSLH